MAIGAGKYDALCTVARETAHARGALVVILDGDQGNGFSCQAEGDVLARLPAILEAVAKALRREGVVGPAGRG